jgi:hypothetical protein
MVGLVDAGRDFIEAEAIRLILRPGGAPPQQCWAEQGGGGGNAECAAHHFAAIVALEDKVADGGADGRAQRHIVVGLVSLGPVAEFVTFRHMLGSVSV